MASSASALTIRQGEPYYPVGTSENADATAKLFDLSPDNVIFFANKELMSIGVARNVRASCSILRSRAVRFITSDDGGPDAEDPKA